MEARRPKASAPPQTRTFEPTKFYRVSPAASHPGDTIRTTTVDAGGRDAQGVRRRTTRRVTVYLPVNQEGALLFVAMVTPLRARLFTK